MSQPRSRWAGSQKNKRMALGEGYGMGDVKLGQIDGQYPPRHVMCELSCTDLLASTRTQTSITSRGYTLYGLLAMTRGQLLRALFDAHAAGATATAARVERELVRRGQPRR